MVLNIHIYNILFHFFFIVHLLIPNLQLHNYYTKKNKQKIETSKSSELKDYQDAIVTIF